MKKSKKRIISMISICLILILSINIIIPIKQSFAEIEFNLFEETNTENINVADGIVGVLIGGIKLIPLVLGGVLQLIISAITGISGDAVATPAEIIFNEVKFLRLDFFKNSTESVTRELSMVVGTWYTVIRNLSIVVLVGILVYIGIRMAISTVAEEEAKYKKMLKDWFMSLVLVFLLHYIMIGVIEINNILVDTLKTAFQATSEGSLQGRGALSQVTLYLVAESLASIGFVQGVGCALLYMMIVTQTFIFLLMYIKRLITIAFLIIIAPLITITYALDKMGDGKSQALNTWLKEFSYNVLIQVFHCIIYATLVGTAVQLISTSHQFLGLILSISGIAFMFSAEGIVKKIFGFEATSLPSGLASGASSLALLGAIRGKGRDNADAKVPTKMEQGSSQSGVGETRSRVRTQDNVNMGFNVVDGQDRDGINILYDEGSPERATQAGMYTVKDELTPAERKRMADREKTKKFLKRYIGTGAKVGTMAALGAMGAATGDMKGTMTGVYAGSSMYNSLKGYGKDKSIEGRVEENQQIFAQDVINWSEELQIEEGDLTTSEIIQRAKNIAESDPTTLSERDKVIYDKMYEMEKTFRQTGAGDSAEDMMLDTMDMALHNEIDLDKKPGGKIYKGTQTADELADRILSSRPSNFIYDKKDKFKRS